MSEIKIPLALVSSDEKAIPLVTVMDSSPMADPLFLPNVLRHFDEHNNCLHGFPEPTQFTNNENMVSTPPIALALESMDSGGSQTSLAR